MPTHTTPDGRRWRIVHHHGRKLAELLDVPPMRRLLTTDFRGFVPPVSNGDHDV